MGWGPTPPGKHPAHPQARGVAPGGGQAGPLWHCLLRPSSLLLPPALAAERRGRGPTPPGRPWGASHPRNAPATAGRTGRGQPQGLRGGAIGRGDPGQALVTLAVTVPAAIIGVALAPGAVDVISLTSEAARLGVAGPGARAAFHGLIRGSGGRAGHKSGQAGVQG